MTEYFYFIKSKLELLLTLKATVSILFKNLVILCILNRKRTKTEYHGSESPSSLNLRIYFKSSLRGHTSSSIQKLFQDMDN